MAYSTCAQVAALIPNILNGASNFDNLDAAVRPASAGLITFMSSGCAIIETKLKTKGYSVPVAATSRAYGLLAQAEAFYAAYLAEAARSSPRVAAGERTRSEMFRREFDNLMKQVMLMDLSADGVTMSDTGWYVGGISQSEKEDVESDTDRTGYRFKRGLLEGTFTTSAS